jgi:YD repeat-containing protein
MPLRPLFLSPPFSGTLPSPQMAKEDNKMRTLYILIAMLMLPTVAEARWYPDEMPTTAEIADTMEHALKTFDDGSCRKKAYRAAHPGLCHRVGRAWKTTKPGAWSWKRPKQRAKYYERGRLETYAARELEVLTELGACDGTMSKKCFDYLVAVNEEFMRQTKYRYDAHSRYNKATHEMCRTQDFRSKWPAQCSRKGGQWFSSGVKFEFADVWCEKAAKRYGHLTPAFRRRCPAGRLRRADLGMGQGHMSTLNKLGRQFCAAHPEECPGGWHYTMVLDPMVSIWTTTKWIVQQADGQHCGRWFKTLTKAKTRGVMKTKQPPSTYSCLKTRRCGGTPMKVGNPDSCCTYMDEMRASFQAVLEPA